MSNHGNLFLKEQAIEPTIGTVEQALGDSYPAYEIFQNALPNLELEQEWQWYTPYKAWFARGQHRWATPRGTKKEKTLYWLYVYEGYFDIAIWFKEKNREEILKADISEKTTQLIRNAETMGKLPTFPVVFGITTAESLADIYTLIGCKKLLEK